MTRSRSERTEIRTGLCRAARRAATAADVVAAVALVALVAAVVLPAAAGAARKQDRRVHCATNLRQIGQGMFMYANENKGNFPRVRFDPADANTVRFFTNWKTETSFPSPRPEEAAKMKAPEPNDVTAAFYLVLKTQDLTADVMVCPESKAKRMTFETDNVRPAGPGAAGGGKSGRKAGTGAGAGARRRRGSRG